MLKIHCTLLALVLLPGIAHSQGTVPVFSHSVGKRTLTLAGKDPKQALTTTIPTVLVPVTLRLQSQTPGGAPVLLDATSDTEAILHSPVFAPYAFSAGNKTQYADAMLRTTFPANPAWHTLLGAPEVEPITIDVPAANGYLLHSQKNGGSLAVVDADFVQQQLFKLLPHPAQGLVVAFTHNTTFYAAGDATICCTWGTHGIDEATGTSFVLGSYLKGVPALVEAQDVQPLTQQLAEFFYDPKHNPQHYGYNVTEPGNAVPSWHFAGKQNSQDCGGTGIGSSYFLLEPTDTNLKNNIPASRGFVARQGASTFHLQNVALLPWYVGPGDDLGTRLSFPDDHALTALPTPCTRMEHAAATPSATPVPADTPNQTGHRLIGYWTGHGPGHTALPLHAVSPQWDIVIVAFASPDKHGPEGQLRFAPPNGLDAAELKADIAQMKAQGRKVMVSLGGGGEYFTLADKANIPNFVASVTSIVAEYGFDGVDIDFETPSLVVQPGDTDFEHPTTPSIVNLIAGLRQLHDHFGPGFMLSLVPEGPQLPAGAVSYGGQFGSYLPITYALRDILSFVDVQDYNTPPMEGLDGEVHQSHTIGYHAALTELLLRGFPAGTRFFPPMPPSKVAVGFLTDYDTPLLVKQSMEFLLSGRSSLTTPYTLHRERGYPDLLGAMFWTIDDDLGQKNAFSDQLGPLLHRAPADK
ncbi:glycosyl hydrolase family 18 protein [Acidipila sp. EB88]|uniref:glycosyl hydrolase family 18 protein n=1 Tax=Acidipila sp. EB88 TaxID=2305226 RepID=UPI000F5F00E8|nr:glycosyl hydrolase family 18 protein [Acidipila sp. EB88]RRA47879.1 glycoside hydrolase [Acidipila sp. EB88]